jgi:hypothetical protein
MSATEETKDDDDHIKRVTSTIKVKAGIAHRMRFLTKAEHDEIVAAATKFPPSFPLTVSVTFKMDYAEWAECAKLAVADPKAWSKKYEKRKEGQ